jgi:hypothetical protein
MGVGVVMRTETELFSNPDAQVWAQEFLERFGWALRDEPARVIDEGLMIGWFANAIECGKTVGYAKAIADLDLLTPEERRLLDLLRQVADQFQVVGGHDLNEVEIEIQRLRDRVLARAYPDRRGRAGSVIE